MKEQKKTYEIDMCEGPLLGKILIFAIPLMLSSILQLLFNAADVVVVGRYAGSEALAAVGSTTALNKLIVNLFIGFSVGAGFLISKYYGAKEERAIDETVHTSITFAAIIGVVLAFAGYECSKPLLRLMGSPEDVIDLAAVYMQIIFLGMPAFMVYNYGSSILRAIGDTKRPLYYLTIAGVVNVILNLYFVIRLNLSVVGVGLATILSQYISAGLLLRCLCNLEGSCRLELKRLKIYGDKLLEVVRYGLPAGLQNSIFETSNVLIQSSINSFGSIVMAGTSAATNIEGFAFAALNSFHVAAMSFTSQNLGGKKYDRIPKILIRCILCSVSMGLLVGAACYFFGEELIGIYSSDAEVISYGMIRLRWFCVPYFLFGIMDVMLGMQRGLGYAVLPTVVSLTGACGFRILWIKTAFEKWRSLDVLFASYPLSWIITGTVHIMCFTIVWKKVKKRVRKEK